MKFNIKKLIINLLANKNIYITTNINTNIAVVDSRLIINNLIYYSQINKLTTDDITIVHNNDSIVEFIINTDFEINAYLFLNSDGNIVIQYIS